MSTVIVIAEIAFVYFVGLFLFTYLRKLVARRFLVAQKLQLGLSDWGIYLIALVVTCDQVNRYGRLTRTTSGLTNTLRVNIEDVPANADAYAIKQFFDTGELIIWPFIVIANLICMPLWACGLAIWTVCGLTAKAVYTAWRWTTKV